MGFALAKKLEIATGPLPARAFIGDPATRDVVAAVFAERNWPEDGVQPGGAAAALRHPHDDGALPLLVVDIAESSNPAADIAALAATGAAQRIVAVGAVNDVTLFRDLIASGAADYLVKPISRHALLAALMAAPLPAAQATVAKPVESGRTFAVIGARGGVGASTIAANLAWLMANEQRRKVALLDLDLHFGTAALLLDLVPGRGLREALERPSRIDSLFLERALEKQGERLHVLAGEEPLADELALDPSAPAVLLHELRNRFDRVIVDLPRNAGMTERQALAAASAIVVVLDLTLPALRDTLRVLALASDCAPDATLLLVAGGAGAGGLAQADFEKGLGRKIDFIVPHDRKAVVAAATAGKPLALAASGAKAIAALRPLAARLDGAAPAKRSFTFWRRAR